MMNVRLFLMMAALLCVTIVSAEESVPAPTEPSPAPVSPAETVPAAESVPAAEPGAAESSAVASPAPVEPAKAEPQPAPVEEKKIDTAAKEPPEPKKEAAGEEKPEIVRPYFGVAIASGVFGLLALASGFYFDSIAEKSFNSYKKMTSREAIEAAIKKPGFDPKTYIQKTNAKYDEGRQHLNSRNYSFIGGAIFVAAGVGLFFWTEEKKPEDKKKEEPVSDKKVSLRTIGDQMTLNFSGSF
jgi:hypothetical protein